MNKVTRCGVMSVVAAGLTFCTPDKMNSGEHSAVQCVGVLDAEGEPLQTHSDDLGSLVCGVTAEVNAYWTQQGKPEIAAVPVVYVEGDDRYVCDTIGGASLITDDDRVNQYCTNSKQIVVSRQDLLDAGPLSGETQRAKVWRVIGHEKRHAQQPSEGIDFDTVYNSRAGRFRVELQAECGAWEVVRLKAPELLDETEASVSELSERSQARMRRVFEHVTAGGGCSLDELEAAEVIPPHPSTNTHWG
jgi:hypothetical protein